MKVALFLLAFLAGPAHACPNKPVRVLHPRRAPRRERFSRLGAEPMAMAPAEFARFVQREIENAERIARASGIKAQ